jgi:hypothetical protein
MNPAIRSKLAEIKFPDEREKLARDTATGRDASHEEKLAILLDLIELSEAISSASPHRARQIELLAENERRGHRLLKDFIRFHTARQDG